MENWEKRLFQVAGHQTIEQFPQPSTQLINQALSSAQSLKQSDNEHYRSLTLRSARTLLQSSSKRSLVYSLSLNRLKIGVPEQIDATLIEKSVDYSNLAFQVHLSWFDSKTSKYFGSTFKSTPIPVSIGKQKSQKDKDESSATLLGRSLEVDFVDEASVPYVNICVHYHCIIT